MSDRSRLSSSIAAPGDEVLRRYPGGKNGAGVYQRLINLMPPHDVYVEAFLGSGALLRRKRPASVNVGIDLDGSVIARFRDSTRLFPANKHVFIHGDATGWLAEAFTDGRIGPGTLVYCDPPYIGAARRSRGRIYTYEMLDEAEHVALLQLLKSLAGGGVMVLVSGYASVTYDTALQGWRRVEFQAMTRGGVATEVAWMSYPEPTELHDYRFLGEDFHDRCRIARKVDRWSRRLASLPALERAAILDALGVAAGRERSSRG